MYRADSAMSVGVPLPTRKATLPILCTMAIRAKVTIAGFISCQIYPHYRTILIAEGNHTTKSMSWNPRCVSSTTGEPDCRNIRYWLVNVETVPVMNSSRNVPIVLSSTTGSLITCSRVLHCKVRRSQRNGHSFLIGVTRALCVTTSPSR